MGSAAHKLCDTKKIPLAMEGTGFSHNNNLRSFTFPELLTDRLESLGPVN